MKNNKNILFENADNTKRHVTRRTNQHKFNCSNSLTLMLIKLEGTRKYFCL